MGAESSWMAQTGPRDHVVAPGLTVGDLVDFFARPPTPEGWVFEPDIVFARTPQGDLCLHLYRPEAPGQRCAGVIFVHGGGWASGHPYAHIRRACLLAHLGFITATIDYRGSDVAAWPAQLQDVRAALAWLRARAAALQLDADRIAAVGDSAGAHLIALAALEGEPLAALVLLYPVVDLTAVPALEGEVGQLVGRSRRARRLASPIAHVRRGAPPTLTIAGAEDGVVPVATVRAFHDALDGVGVTNELIVVDGMPHAFDWYPEAWQMTHEPIVRFLRAQLELSASCR